jgi:Family of unknown function (DUF5763)
MPLKRLHPTLARCKATTSSGERCKAKPHKDDLCFFHSDPKKAAELWPKDCSLHPPTRRFSINATRIGSWRS